MKELKVGTTFSGIGAPEFALHHLYGKDYKNKVKLKWACDFDTNAKKSFLANHNPNKFYDNIYYMTHSKNELLSMDGFFTNNAIKGIEEKNDDWYGLDNVSDIDLYVFGFPCQNFSVANQNRDNFKLDNFDVNNPHMHQRDLGVNATKTTLVYQSMKLIEELSKRKNPLKYFIGENVKGLVQHDPAYKWIPSELSVEEYNKLGKNALKTHTLKVEEDGTEVVYKRVNGLRLDGKDYNGYPSIFNPEEYDGKKKFIGKTLYVIENSMKELGYKVYWKVLNANDYSFPESPYNGGVQNRERIFIVGIKDDLNEDFKWPVKDDIVQDNHDSVLNYLNPENNKNKQLLLNKKFIKEKNRVKEGSGICNQTHFLTNVKYEQGQRIYSANKKSPCLTCVGAPRFYIKQPDGTEIFREVDGPEMLSIQGFPIGKNNRGKKDDNGEYPIEEFKFAVSDNQLKKQAGNSMSVSVMYQIIKNLLEGHNK